MSRRTRKGSGSRQTGERFSSSSYAAPAELVDVGVGSRPAGRPADLDFDFGVVPAHPNEWVDSPLAPRRSEQSHITRQRFVPPNGLAPWVGQRTVPAALRIRFPLETRLCFNRKQRREVLFAQRKAGFRGSAPKRSYKRSGDSLYSCR